MENKKLQFAVIGCSGMGKSHMRGIIAKETAELYAICDIDEARLSACKEEYNVPVAVTDYKALVNDPNIDAAVIVLPDQLHLEVTEDFLRAGKDVLCAYIQRYLVEMVDCNDVQLINADVNLDGFINIKDVTHLSRKLAGFCD